MSDLEEPKPSGVSRRTVAKAMAWSVPAVALAVPAPAYAASGPAPTVVFVSACKNPGGSCKTRKFGYSFFYNITNNTGKDIYIYSPLTFVVSNQTGPGVLTWAQGAPTLPALVPNGQTILFEFVTESSNSANLTFDIDFSIDWGHTLPNGSDTDHPPITPPTVSVTGTPPDCACPAV